MISVILSHWGGGIQKSIKIKIKALVIPLARNEVTTVNIMVQYTCRLFSMPLFPTMVLTMWSPIKSISIWKLVRKANSQAPNPDLLNKKFYGWDPATCILTRPVDDSDVWQSLRTSDICYTHTHTYFSPQNGVMTYTLFKILNPYRAPSLYFVN